MSKEYEKLLKGFNPKNLEGRTFDDYKLTEYTPGGNVGFRYKAEEVSDGGEVLATHSIKLCPKHKMRDGWEQEITKCHRLKSEYVAQYRAKSKNDILIEIGDKSIPFIYTVWEYIKGINLREFIKTETFDINFINDFFTQILDVFFQMEDQGVLHHGDLHAGNIMIEKINTISGPKLRIKVTDFGIGGSLNDLNPKDDYELLGNHLRNLLNRLDRQKLPRSDRYIYDFIPPLIRRFEDTNVSSQVRDSQLILNELENIIKRGGRQKQIEYLETPFDYSSAEQLDEESVLLPKLFSNKFPWFDDIKSPQNQLWTGPRGSGKTMIFRSLRLKTKLITTEGIEEAKKDHFIGLYFHCYFNIFSPFSMKKNLQYNELAESFVHHFNMFYSSEIIDTLIACEEKDLFKVDLTFKRRLKEIFCNVLTMTTVPTILDENNILKVLKSVINQECLCNQKKILRQDRVNFDYNLTGFLLMISQELRENIPFLSDKKIYFLLDDFSHPKVNKEIQKIFHSIIWLRNSHYCFKVASEDYSTLVHSIIFKDFNGQSLQQSREYEIINLGEKYLLANEKVCKDFLEDIMNRRLERTKDYDCSIKDIIEVSEFPKNTIGESLRDPTTRKDTLYAGFDVISRLCSNDISIIIDILREIFHQAKSNNELELSDKKPIKKISRKTQDTAIRTFSRNYVSRLKAVSEIGEKLFKITQGFGYYSQHRLYNHGVDHGKGREDEPFECILIDVDDLGEFKKDSTLELYEALIRQGAFIEDRGSSRRFTQSIRLHFRKIYIPYFNISLNSRETLTISKEVFEELLGDPETFFKDRIKADDKRYAEKKRPPSDRKLREFS